LIESIESLKKQVYEARKNSFENNILYTCSYVPRELLEAFDLYAARFVPHGTPSDESLGERKTGPELCSHCKAIAGTLSGLKENPNRLIIGSSSCDQMRRFLETSDHITGVKPLIICSPSTRSQSSKEHFREEILWLANRLSKRLDTQLDKEKLRQAIRVRNLIRRKLRDLRPQLNSSEFFLLVQLDLYLQASQMLDYLNNFKPSGINNEKKVPLMVAGSPFTLEELEFFTMIETMGVKIVADATCTGDRHIDFEIVETGNLLINLADAYFSKTPCIWSRPNNELYDYMKNLIKNNIVWGIIWKSVRFCDVWSTEASRAKEIFGLPLLQIDVTYSDFAAPRIATRVEAFVESLRMVRIGS